MSASKNIISNLSKDKYTIKAQSTQTISFMGASPNYYRITNGGATPLYLGVSMMPTEDYFDMKIPSACTKLHVDAYGHDEVYIYNPSLTDANIIITSFTAEFEPTVLGLSDLGQDFSTVELSGEFDASGDLKTYIDKISKALEKDSPNLEKVLKQLNETWDAGPTIKSYLNDMYNHIKTIKNAVDNNNDVSEFGNVLAQLNTIKNTISDLLKAENNSGTKSDIIIELLQGIQNPETATFTIQGFHKTVDINGEQTIEAPEGRYFSKIISINNSASDNTTVKFNKALGGYDIPEGTSKLIKGLNTINMNCQVHSITINSGTASSYTVVAETKPYRYKETVVNEMGTTGGYILRKGDIITDIYCDYNDTKYSFMDSLDKNNKFYFANTTNGKNSFDILAYENPDTMEGAVTIECKTLPYTISKYMGECWLGADAYIYDEALGDFVPTTAYWTVMRRTYTI